MEDQELLQNHICQHRLCSEELRDVFAVGVFESRLREACGVVGPAKHEAEQVVNQVGVILELVTLREADGFNQGVSLAVVPFGEPDLSVERSENPDDLGVRLVELLADLEHLEELLEVAFYEVVHQETANHRRVCRIQLVGFEQGFFA